MFSFTFCSLLPERASFCFFVPLISLFFALFYEERNVSLVSQGGFERGLLGQRRFSGLFSFFFSPLFNLGSDC